MNRAPNVVTMGLGERVVKPATENSLGRFFFWTLGGTKHERANYEVMEETLSGGKRSRLDGVHLGDRSRSAGILDGSSRHASRTEFSSSLGKDSQLRYVTVFLHRLSEESQALVDGKEQNS